MTSKKKQAIACIISAAFFFALMNLFVKLSGDLPVWQKSMFRNLVAMFIALSVVIKNRTSIRIERNNFFSMAGRCIAGTVGVICNFYAIGKMNIADASMLNKLSPFFAMIFSIFILKEKPKKIEWATIIIAFAGALLVIKPTFNMESFPAFMGVLSGMGAGLAYSCVRKLSKNGIAGPVIVFYFSMFSCLSVVPAMIATFKPMSIAQVSFLILAGLSAAGGQFSITAAYSKAPAKQISVFDYTQVLFAALLSFMILGDLPDLLSFAGYAIIIGVAVYKWKYETSKDTTVKKD